MRYICTSIVATLMLAEVTFAETLCAPQQTTKLTADDGAVSDYFGNNLALDAGVAVMGPATTTTTGTDPAARMSTSSRRTAPGNRSPNSRRMMGPATTSSATESPPQVALR